VALGHRTLNPGHPKERFGVICGEMSGRKLPLLVGKGVCNMKNGWTVEASPVECRYKKGGTCKRKSHKKWVERDVS